MSCEPERVTGYVDGALDAAERARIEAHLGACSVCREQVDFEVALRQRLRGLPAPALDPALEGRIRARPGRRGRLLRWALPIAAGLALLALARGSGPVLAWQLAEDHSNCHAIRMLAAAGGADDRDDGEPPSASEAADLQQLPRSVNGIPLTGASVCALRDGTLVMHVQYVGDGKRVSLFVVHRPVAVWASFGGHLAGSDVRLLHQHGRVVGLVADSPADVEVFVKALSA